MQEFQLSLHAGLHQSKNNTKLLSRLLYYVRIQQLYRSRRDITSNQHFRTLWQNTVLNDSMSHILRNNAMSWNGFQVTWVMCNVTRLILLQWKFLQKVIDCHLIKPHHVRLKNGNTLITSDKSVQKCSLKTWWKGVASAKKEEIFFHFSNLHTIEHWTICLRGGLYSLSALQVNLCCLSFLPLQHCYDCIVALLHCFGWTPCNCGLESITNLKTDRVFLRNSNSSNASFYLFLRKKGC